MSGILGKKFLTLVLGCVVISTVWASGPWHAGKHNTGGWRFMTSDERIEHQRHMRKFETYKECKTYQAKHDALMAERALRQGIVLKPKPKSGCGQLRRRGRLE